MDYNSSYLKINNNNYFITPIPEGDTMISNWESFRALAYGNYKTLIKLRDSNVTKPDTFTKTSNKLNIKNKD